MMFGKCKPSKRLDLSKIDSTYFIGSYTCNLDGKIERITLKADGTYEYHWEPENIKIENAGKWFFDKINGENRIYYFVTFTNFPNYRQVLWEDSEKNDRSTVGFEIDCSFEPGNLETLIRGGEQYYIFKPDKRKKVN